MLTNYLVITLWVLVVPAVFEVVVCLHVMGPHHTLGLDVARCVFTPDHHLDVYTLVRFPAQQLPQGPVIDPQGILASKQSQLGPY